MSLPEVVLSFWPVDVALFIWIVVDEVLTLLGIAHCAQECAVVVVLIKSCAKRHKTHTFFSWSITVPGSPFYLTFTQHLSNPSVSKLQRLTVKARQSVPLVCPLPKGWIIEADTVAPKINVRNRLPIFCLVEPLSPGNWSFMMRWQQVAIVVGIRILPIDNIRFSTTDFKLYSPD